MAVLLLSAGYNLPVLEARASFSFLLPFFFCLFYFFPFIFLSTVLLYLVERIRTICICFLLCLCVSEYFCLFGFLVRIFLFVFFHRVVTVDAAVCSCHVEFVYVDRPFRILDSFFFLVLFLEYLNDNSTLIRTFAVLWNKSARSN